MQALYGGNINLPSPPSSPRMSGFSPNQSTTGWQSQHFKTDSANFHSDNNPITSSNAETTNGNHLSGPQPPPLLRSYKSSSFLFDSAQHSPHHSQGQNGESSIAGSINSNPGGSQGVENHSQSNVANAKIAASAPASPVSGRSHVSPRAENYDDPANELQELDFDMDDDDDPEQSGIKPEMTAAEIRAQKRKMKRFRLTHNQTRFLMSEFARQAHPDAAHRERLSREIPGLSPRQVQVWFQNRRAKLKRLNSDDRERMMSSRALPENFDMTQALHSPFGAVNPVNQNGGTPLASPAPFGQSYPGQFPGQLPGSGGCRPLTLDTAFRRGPDNQHMSPTGISPALSSFAFTPPQSATDTISPVSTSAAESSPFGYMHTPPGSFAGSPKRPNPFGGPYNTSPGYPAGPAHPKIPRLNIYDRMGSIGRSRAESLQSPLRTSISYSTLTNDAHPQPTDDYSTPRTDAAVSFAEEGPRSIASSLSSAPYGIGHSYGQIPGFQASAAARNRSFSNGAPRRIELPPSSLYRPGLQRINSTPQTATFPSYHSQPLATPPAHSQTANMSAPYNITQFPNSYLRNDESHHQQHYSPVAATFGEPSLRNGNGHNSETNLGNF
ncbi:MAG: hypothetical protein M1822_006263 [Bathelium mastoideum]|nr:MAG: hypothetical protein M1822_006263 [Bathelium mastoideum]